MLDEQHSCESSGSITINDQQTGIITNHHPEKRIDAACAWIIEGENGQTITLTLVDFGAETRNHEDWNHCHKLGAILESAVYMPINICASDQKESIIYESKTNQVEITFEEIMQPGQPRFLVKFDGEAILFVEPLGLSF